jgi:hypothetical protein
MPALITELIDKRDSFEIVRDQIAAILVLESAKQVELASDADQDPALWALRVFTERANPWAAFESPDPNEPIDPTPIVHVGWNNTNFDKRLGNVVEQQAGVGIFNVDCYGYGLSQATVGGHLPGDQQAQLEAQRAARLVRNILTAGAYTYLALRGTVARRWVDSMTMLPTSDDGRTVHHVAAVRIALEVTFNEYSPQVQGVPIESVAVEVVRQDTGQLLLRATYP